MVGREIAGYAEQEFGIARGNHFRVVFIKFARKSIGFFPSSFNVGVCVVVVTLAEHPQDEVEGERRMNSEAAAPFNPVKDGVLMPKSPHNCQ